MVNLNETGNKCIDDLESNMLDLLGFCTGDIVRCYLGKRDLKYSFQDVVGRITVKRVISTVLSGHSKVEIFLQINFSDNNVFKAEFIYISNHSEVTKRYTLNIVQAIGSMIEFDEFDECSFMVL